MTAGPESEQPLRITPDMLLGRRVDFERRMRRLPRVTAALMGILVAVFLAEMAAGALDSRPAIVAAGALERGRVAAGQYWRLLSGTFLHGDGRHLVSNLIALYIVGMVAEHAFGRRQFALLYLGSAVAGSLLSVLTNAPPSVGASGAIFGLQAAAVVLFRRHREGLVLRDRRLGVVLAVWALYSIAGGIVTPYIDNAAHIGGALGGALLARQFHPAVLEPLPPDHARRVRLGLVGAGLALAYTLVGWLRS